MRPAAHRDDARRPPEGGRLRHRAGRQVAPGRRRRSTTRRSAASTSSSASSAARTPTSPARAPTSSAARRRTDEKEYLTDAFGREAVAFIDRHKEQPFFLYLAFNAVHTPMHATDARLKKFANITDRTRRTYAAMMSAMDDAIGKVLAKLRDAKLEENTLVIFISDNGGPTMQGTTINGSINTPLRGSKRTTLEGGIRVPFFVSWPGKLPPGKTYDQPVIQLDLCRPPWPPPKRTCRAGREARRREPAAVPHRRSRRRARRTTPCSGGSARRWRSARATGSWSDTIRSPTAARAGQPRRSSTTWPTDIGETTDLAAKEPDKVKELQALWDDWNKGNVAPLWGGGKKN